MRKGIVLLCLIGFLLLMGITVIPFFVNPGKSYSVENENVFYGDEIMEGVRAKEVRFLGDHVMKDCTKVYYKDQLLEWADAETFEWLGKVLYTDKNGIYYETVHPFRKNQIVPLEGDYDKATFRNAGFSFYKDRNSVYQIRVQLFGSKPDLLKKVSIPGLDVETFEGITYNWAADKDRIYFSDDYDLKPCPEIDRATFEVLSYKIAKDKNHVYYRTLELESEGQAATTEEDYAILKDADAPTFEMIDVNTYVDKNTTWSISKQE